MSFHNHEPEEYNRRFGVHERQKKEQQKKAEAKRNPEVLPNGIVLHRLYGVLKYSNKYEISIQFWPDQIAIYIAKDGVDLIDFGGDFEFAIGKAMEYLDRINNQNQTR